jgi:hypothetical protein
MLIALTPNTPKLLPARPISGAMTTNPIIKMPSPPDRMCPSCALDKIDPS